MSEDSQEFDEQVRKYNKKLEELEEERNENT